MDIVLGVSMEPSAVRLLLIEGANANGVTVEEEQFEVAPPLAEAGDSANSGSAAQVIAALIGTREGVAEGGYHLASTGVTWTDPTGVPALRIALAAHDAGSVMLISPLLAAAALAQSVGFALDYAHIAMLFVEVGSATLAVVDVADGSIVDLHRQSLKRARSGPSALAAELAPMVVGLDAPGSRADGVFLIGCGVDIVPIKPALEAATSLVVSAPEEPDMALARGAALASANAPLFASSTAALAYALDPGTGEVSPRALTPSYLDVCANADPGEGALAYSALDDGDLGDHGDFDDHGHPADEERSRKPLALVGSALAAVAAFAGGFLVVSLASDVRPTAAARPSPHESVLSPESQAPNQLPGFPPGFPYGAPDAQSPAPSAVPAAPPVEVATPPPVVQQPPQTVTKPPQYMAPVTQPRRAPTREAPVPTPVEAAPSAAPPPVVAAPAPAPAAPAVPTQPPMTMYLHLPFVSIPIPITPPPPPAPPAPEPAP